MMINFSQHVSRLPPDPLAEMVAALPERWTIMSIDGEVVIHNRAIKFARTKTGLYSQVYYGVEALTLIAQSIVSACASHGGVAYNIESWNEKPEDLETGPEMHENLEQFVRNAVIRLEKNFDPDTYYHLHPCLKTMIGRMPRRVADQLNRPVQAGSTQGGSGSPSANPADGGPTTERGPEVGTPIMVSFSQHATTNAYDVFQLIEHLPGERYTLLTVGGRFRALLHRGNIRYACLVTGLLPRPFCGIDALNLVVTDILSSCATSGGIGFTIETWKGGPPPQVRKPDQINISAKTFVANVYRSGLERFDDQTYLPRQPFLKTVFRDLPRRVYEQIRPRVSPSSPPQNDSSSCDENDVDRFFRSFEDVDPQGSKSES